MTTTTTKKITPLLNGWSGSTTYCGSQFYRVETRATSAYFVTLRADDAADRRHSISGKKPRGVIAAEREATDANYRARMSQARVALAADLYQGSPPSLMKMRIARGMSQHQLAEAVGTSQPHIAKIESRKVSVYLATAAKIADVLGLSLDEVRGVLLDGTPSELQPDQTKLVSTSQ